MTQTFSSLEDIAREIRSCHRCDLSFSRKNPVPGDGNAEAEIMFIGEGPGFYEDEQGLPFVGPAGQFLNELLRKAGLERKDVFITNVVKCRPPGNREPQENELSACRYFLEHQIEIIKPRLIVTLGRFSMANYFHEAKISVIHGTAMWVRGQMIVPMYHPAAALHQPSLRNSIEKDFAKLPEYIHKARTLPTSSVSDDTSVSQESEGPEAKQLDLF